MPSQLIKVDGRYVYFFTDIESALEESSYFEEFEIYQYEDLQLYIVGEKNTLDKKRSHLYDWNGQIFPVRRGESDEIENWSIDFKNKLCKVSVINGNLNLNSEVA